MKKKYVIVGTGFAAAAATSILLKKKIKPILIDIGKKNFTIDTKDKKKLPLGIEHNNVFNSLKNVSINQSDLLASEGFGGLSKIWGGAINKPHKNVLKKWPINLKKLIKYFKHVDNFFLHEGTDDYYSKEFDLKKPDKLIKNNLIENLFKKNNKKILIGNARRAINKNKDIFSLNKYFLKLKRKGKIEIINNFNVEKIINTKKEIIILSKNKNFHCHKLFIACGPLSTAKIILNSFKEIKYIDLKETTLISSLWFTFRKLNYYESKLYCDYFLTKLSGNLFSSQIYILKNKITDKIFLKQNLFKQIFRLIPNFIKNKFLIFLTYIDDKNSKNVRISKDKYKGFIILSTKNNVKTYKKIKSKINYFFQNKLLHLIDIKKNFGYGYHFGSSFPISNKKNKRGSDKLGRILNMKNIHIIDASVLPSIPVSTITYTMMANASCIVDESVRKR